jgi:hypothetical protein
MTDNNNAHLSTPINDQHQVAVPTEETVIDLPEISVEDLLIRARRKIDSGVVSLRSAAEDLAAAQDRGATQRELADAVGKSVGWINGLLAWRKRGYDDTPFGPSSKKSRHQSRLVQASERKRLKATDRFASTMGFAASGALGDPVEADTRTTAEADVVELDDSTTADALRDNRTDTTFSNVRREKLIEALEFLGTSRPHLRAKLALNVERRRAELGRTWDELLIPAEEAGAQAT